MIISIVIVTVMVMVIGTVIVMVISVVAPSWERQLTSQLHDNDYHNSHDNDQHKSHDKHYHWTPHHLENPMKELTWASRSFPTLQEVSDFLWPLMTPYLQLIPENSAMLHELKLSQNNRINTLYHEIHLTCYLLISHTGIHQSNNTTTTSTKTCIVACCASAQQAPGKGALYHNTRHRKLCYASRDRTFPQK